MAYWKEFAVIAAACAAALPAQTPKPETLAAFGCYVQSAEARMASRKTFLAIEATPAEAQSLARGTKIVTTPGNGSNPHKIQGAMIYDWIGTVFIPRATAERIVRMLQDYDHRAEYFADVVATSKLLCRTGESRFGFTMRIKEPTVADSENDVVWERLDPRRWKCRSYSGDVREIGKQHGYLHRLNSYWRFLETADGVFVEGETITLSGEFGSVMRALGSLAGISPEKSLKKTLGSMREAVHSTRDFALPPAGLPSCGETPRLPGCATESRR